MANASPASRRGEAPGKKSSGVAGTGVSLAAGAFALAALIAAAGAAAQQYIYNWTDKDGKIQYSGQPPKNFSGEVIRIDVDPSSAVTTPDPRSTTDTGRKSAPAPAPDVATKRRELRNRLEADLARAREKLELAKTALAEGSVPQDDERQVIQQRMEKGGPPPASGAMHGSAPRSNCRVVTGADGKTATICAAIIPNEAYHERQRLLEEAVRVAQAELAASEQAYRRGVD